MVPDAGTMISELRLRRNIGLIQIFSGCNNRGWRCVRLRCSVPKWRAIARQGKTENCGKTQKIWENPGCSAQAARMKEGEYSIEIQ